MVVLAMYTTNVLHPGFLLKDAKITSDIPLEKASQVPDSTASSTTDAWHGKAITSVTSASRSSV